MNNKFYEMQLIYINPGNSSVMESQVLSLLNYYDEQGIFKKITLLQGYKNQNEKVQILKKLNRNLNTVWYHALPNLLFFWIFEYYNIKATLKKLKIDNSITIVHIRGQKAGALVYRHIIKNKIPLRILVDLRGVVLEEYQIYYEKSKISSWFKKKEALKYYKTLSKGAMISVVSPTLLDYFIRDYSFKREKLVIHPNIASEKFIYNADDRRKIREKLKLKSNEIVAIISTGGNAAWQKDFVVAEMILKLDIKIINLSKTELKIPGIINTFVPHHEVPKYLSAADIAILWRDENMVNRVASPSKFSEFAVSGLLTIHNGTIDLVSDYINTTGFGIITKNTANFNITELQKQLAYDRHGASMKGFEYFGVDNIAESYIKTYELLLEDTPV